MLGDQPTVIISLNRPLPFLRALGEVVIKSGISAFNVSAQQDAPEILLHILSDCASASPRLYSLFKCEIFVDSFCELCDISLSDSEF